jgi:potassium efflux system protein
LLWKHPGKQASPPMRTVLLLALLQWPIGMPAPSSPASTPTAAEPTDGGIAAIPVPQILRSGEDAYRTLRAMSEQLEKHQLVDDIHSRLPAIVARVEPLAARGAVTARRDLADLRPALLRADQTLAGWDSELEGTVRTLFADRQELQRMDATWAATEREAREEQVPPALLERSGALRAAIATTAVRTRAQLDELLATQNQVASVRLRIADALATVSRADQLEAEQLFEVESVPFWKLLGRPDPGEKLRQQIVQTLRIHAVALTDFIWVQSGRALLLLGVLLLLTVALWRGRRKLEAEMAADPEVVTAVEVLLHPLAAASLLTLVLAGLFLDRPPVVVSQVILLGMLVAFFAAGGSLIPQRARRSTYALAIIVAVHVLSTLTPELSLLRRSLLLAVSVFALALMLGELRGRGWESEMPTPRWRSLLRAGLMVASLLLVVSLVANLVGNVTLAHLLTTGTLASAAAALLLSGVGEVLQGVLVIGLRSRRVNRWPVIRDNAELFRARGTRLLRWVVGLIWIYATTRVFKIGMPVLAAMKQVVQYQVRMGSLDLSLADVLAFAFTLWISILLSRLVAFLLEEGLANKHLARGVPAAISRTASYAVIAVGTILAFLASGMELTKFTVIVGTLGVGIGFGLQNVVNNFVSGLILLYERPVQVGDVIEVGKVTGTVRRIGIRSSTVATPQGAEVVVPNANLISNEVTNWTLSDRRRRADIDVGVAYGTPPEKVRSLLLQVAGAHHEVIKFPEPMALFTGFGDSALNFQLLVWTAADTWGRVASELRTEICRVLEQEGISIPFPQRDLHLVSVDASVAETLRGKGEPVAEEPGDVLPGAPARRRSGPS